ncbi:mitochondrial distribution and morphology protein 10 [Gloeophyllum trabeum ATCC 11539]|uniref:Mitochondrial distribution and morphology protein 10 n=1 Tax=Gloeophyllum trabeum (strain ATCC 11539 / FP-39264 / Madison 617) TaxID=670483 RepID=S7QHW4_GLOTA|nr:mitochondrial distribution and morphology protein 10 [Gloeophyllum trabeum ATCC 11539]EPQ59366.1 mitochondrial distribution and morphology protein 10 [Gloeophyllum trabeum ATCC 11539]
MHPFASYVLRSYYKATGWNEDNLYSNFTRSSSSILDFTVPRGLHFSISKSPNALFKTTYSMNALPSLNGSIGYIFTSCDLNVKGSGDVRFKDMVDRFRVYDQPRRPEGKEEVWLAGERVDTRDYLLYGRFYIPTGRLDALYSARLSGTMQGMIAAISDPRPLPLGASNLMLSLQHDTGRTCTEYTWSADDSMWGVRFLYNFGKIGTALESPGESEQLSTPVQTDRSEVKRVDEEEAMEGGLKGRISAGAEVYFSAREKSAGVSTGIRFTTLPDATAPSFQPPDPSSSPLSLSSSRTPHLPQPPTTITALFNPMMGHISGAYAARVSRDLSVCSRFDLNVYSYESEWTMGAEWWLRRKPVLHEEDTLDAKSSDENSPDHLTSAPAMSETWTDDVLGVVKARASTTTDVSLMWEGRLRNMLVSLGIVSNLSSRSKPIKAVGLELAYFSSG